MSKRRTVMHGRWISRRFAIRGIAIFFTLASLALLASYGNAQETNPSDVLNNLSTDQLQQMFSAAQNRPGSTSGESSSIQPQTTVLEPTAPANPVLPRSRLELIMSARAGVALTQFGYDQLGIGRPVVLPQLGGVQDNYMLGPGDEIVVDLRGQANAEYRATVDRDGQVVLPRLSPVAAAGRTLGDFRQDLIASIHRAYVATEGFVSIGRVRQISVIVAGEVGTPGVRTLTGLSSPVDAILVSGGIKKSGSLRNVQVIHEGHARTIDLYAFLTDGVSLRNLSLADGDRVVVPTLSKTVAVAGWVRRPGIYEMSAGRSAMTTRELTALAGGLEVRGRYRTAILRVTESGQTQLAPVTNQSEIVRDGEILVLLPEANEVVNRATLSGSTSLAGGYSIKPGMHVSELLKSPGALGTSPYTVFGIISRKDPRTYLRTLVAFSPIAALDGEDDPILSSDDIVRVFSMSESRLLSATLTEHEKDRAFREEVAHNPYAIAQPSAGSSPLANSTQSASSQQALASGQLLSNKPIATAAGPAADMAQSSSYLQNLCAQIAPYGTVASFGEQVADQGNPANLTAQEIQAQTLNQPQNGTTAAAADANNPQGTAPSLIDQCAQLRGGQNPPLAANFEQELATPGSFPSNREAHSIGQIASQLDVDVVVLLNFLEDHEVTLDGAVRGPGTYVIGPGINLHDLVMVAGGTQHWADKSGVELISTVVDNMSGRSATSRRTLALDETNLSSYIVRPRDELRFHEVFTDVGVGSVTLEGEVRFPGEYKIMRGEHLSDLLRRAGGLTDVAYPYGTVFLRRSVAAVEEESFRRAAENVENQLLVGMTHMGTTNKLDPSTFGALQGFVTQVRAQKGLGRISITADPAILARRPEQNALLESGDVIYIPQRPNTISVMGEVLQPGSFVYNAKLFAKDYVTKAGGFTSFADDSLTYIVLPDGTAEQLESGGWLPFGGQTIPPGSVIIVPRDVAPLLWSDILQNSTSIFSQLAIAGASLAVIAHP